MYLLDTRVVDMACCRPAWDRGVGECWGLVPVPPTVFSSRGAGSGVPSPYTCSREPLLSQVHFGGLSIIVNIHKPYNIIVDYASNSIKLLSFKKFS